ncbi:MAG: hypothetical protein R6U94_15065 [Nitriliruptoraceae bacterium]
MSAPTRPPTTTAAQARVIDEVLAWGRPRPLAPVGLVAALEERLGAAITSGGDRAGASPVGRRVLGVRALVAAGTPGGQGPLVQDRATVRGILLGRSFARDVERRHVGTPERVVAAVADELAAERPADPASASAWWNAAPPEVRAGLLAEIGDVLADVRMLWPPLPGDHLDVSVRPQVRASVAGGRVLLAARPDLVLDSPRRDDRARALVIVTRTGMPRPVEDRALARASALVHTLATGRPPFRWVVLHLTDGRLEVEELDPQVLADTAERMGTQVARSLAGPGQHAGGRDGDDDGDDRGDEHGGAQE